MKEEDLSWTLKIMNIFSEVSGQFYMHSANYKEKEMEEQLTTRIGGEGDVK